MKKVFFTTMLLCLLLVGCKPEAELPTVVTQEVLDVTDGTARIICNVVNDGGAEVTSRGVCWSMSENPTISDDKTNDGSGIGSFEAQLQDLSENATYYVRAYAVNSVGVSYGEEISFGTLLKERLEFTVNGVTFDMILVQNGTFSMGAQNVDPSAPNYDADAWPREAPVHQVTLSDYYIGETEVTQELWSAVMGSNPSHFVSSQKPVEQVTMYDCMMFIDNLNYLTGMNFRLPTEAEWEYAAKGGNMSQGYKYSGSDKLDDVAWYSAGDRKTHDVKTKAPNELKIFDMSGNVLEWCYDFFGDYSSNSQTNPTGPYSGTDYIVRGGCCLSDAVYCRMTVRNFFNPGGASYGLGMRLALSL